VALAGKTLLAAGKSMLPPRMPATFSLEALSVQDGSVLWKVSLPAAAVDAGVVVNRDGRIVVSLLNGQVLCLGPSGKQSPP
jgi:outer membrane protein assembly factor BamB